MNLSIKICLALASLGVYASNSTAPVTTLTAPLVHSKWSNTIGTSPSVFDPDSTTAQPGATLSTPYVPQTLNSIAASRSTASSGVPTITKTVVVTVTSVFPIPVPTASRFDHNSLQGEGCPTAQDMNDFVVAFNDAMAALATVKARTEQIGVDLGTVAANSPVPANSIEAHDSEDCGSVGSTSIWLLLVEALGFIGVICEVVSFIHGRIQIRRNRRALQGGQA